MKSKEMFPAIFSRHAAEYQRRVADVMARGEARGRMRLIELARASPGIRVLDMACGPGNLTRLLAQRVAPGGEVVGIDLAAGMIELARAEAIPNARFEIMDIENLAFDDRSFDVVTCGHGLQFCPDLHRALRETRRVMRPGGRLVASVPIDGMADTAFEVVADVIDRWLPPRPEVVDQTATRMTVRDPSTFQQAATDSGFAAATVELIEERVTWKSAEYFVSMFTGWWVLASRMEGMEPGRRKAFEDEAVAAMRARHPGAIETTGRNLVLLAEA
jgi:ubiquinone/menaquinone biosynthesis C-methylase UbiE